MTHSNFKFLEKEFPILYNIGQVAEYNLHKDPNTTLMKVRQFGERMSELIFEEHQLRFPYDNTAHNRLIELQSRRILPENIKDLLFNIKKIGNKANHAYSGNFNTAKNLLWGAFKTGEWFFQTYGLTPGVEIGQFKTPENLDAAHAIFNLEEQLNKLQEEHDKLLEERKIGELSTEREKEIQQKSDQAAKKIDFNEDQTRKFLIDPQLRKAGWEVDSEALNFKTKKTMPQRGKNMAIAEWRVGKLWADYALFIGLELYGIVEAKKYNLDISTDLRQSKLYSEAAENKNEAKLLDQWGKYKVPFLFSTNGRAYLKQLETKSGIWFLDIRKERNQARCLKGWISPEGLKKTYEQDFDAAEQKLRDEDRSYLQSKLGLGLRGYQIEAIQKVEEKLLNYPEDRRSLVAMATGTGKTRTIIGLCYRLIKSNRFKRILFMVDRRLLATQAFDSFRDNKLEDSNDFSGIYKVEGLKQVIPDIETRLHFATVQGMVKRLFYSEEGEENFPVDTYDCIIVDEAHRGYLLDKEMDEDELEFKDQNDYMSKYRMVLDYFDAYAVGLTATPALHTKEIFGKPVFTYSYRKAVIDGFLIDHEPPIIIKTKLSEEGIVWEAGDRPKVYDKEENQIVELEELEDELKIEIQGFNRMVITENFNRTVIKELVKRLDPDDDAKTLIFAATDAHADLVVKTLYEEFENIGNEVPHEAIEKITGRSKNPKELVKRYKNEKYPNIAVTVDLLTTGIDVPAISNLVFLRRINSRILYEQMLGRATRLCPDIGKKVFHIYDAVRIYESLKDYTEMKPVVQNPKTTFGQLAEEMNEIPSEARVQKQVEQIIAKLHRKKRTIDEKPASQEMFKYLSKESDPDSFIDMLKGLSATEAPDRLMQMTGLWKFLDELKPDPAYQMISEHHDELVGIETGYGKGVKPEDYLLNFEKFIKENRNKIAALNVVCTRPTALNRKSLKELKLKLNEAGFHTKTLDKAWKDTKNEDIAADIISYIRTLAIGSVLVSHEERVKNAMSKVKQMKEWTKTQLKWLDRFEAELKKEEIIKPEDLNREPFMIDGGFNRLNKIFENELDTVLHKLNEEMYKELA